MNSNETPAFPRYFACGNIAVYRFDSELSGVILKHPLTVASQPLTITLSELISIGTGFIEVTSEEANRIASTRATQKEV